MHICNIIMKNMNSCENNFEREECSSACLVFESVEKNIPFPANSSVLLKYNIM